MIAYMRSFEQALISSMTPGEGEVTKEWGVEVVIGYFSLLMGGEVSQ